MGTTVCGLENEENSTQRGVQRERRCGYANVTEQGQTDAYQSQEERSSEEGRRRGRTREIAVAELGYLTVDRPLSEKPKARDKNQR